MEHNDALQTMASERYLLKEMSEGERDAFEEHFFDCPECAADIRAGAAMMAAGSTVAREGGKVIKFEPKPDWSGWVPQAAAAAIISAFISGAAGWFGALQTIPRVAAVPSIAQPRQVNLDLGENRGPAEAQTRVAAGEAVAFNFFIPPRDEAASYLVTVRDAAGKVGLTQPYTRAQAEESVSPELRDLPRGSYEMVIEGVRKDGKRFSIASVPFVVGER